MNIAGWTTWGSCDLGHDLGKARLFKHYTGIIVAVSEAHIISTEQTMLMLAQMNDHLELDAARVDEDLLELES